METPRLPLPATTSSVGRGDTATGDSCVPMGDGCGATDPAGCGVARTTTPVAMTTTGPGGASVAGSCVGAVQAAVIVATSTRISRKAGRVEPGLIVVRRAPPPSGRAPQPKELEADLASR